VGELLQAGEPRVAFRRRRRIRLWPRYGSRVDPRLHRCEVDLDQLRRADSAILQTLVARLFEDKQKEGGHMNRRAFMGRGAAGLMVGSAFTKVALGAAAKTEGAGSGPVVETTAGKIRGAVQNKVFSFK